MALGCSDERSAGSEHRIRTIPFFAIDGRQFVVMFFLDAQVVVVVGEEILFIEICQRFVPIHFERLDAASAIVGVIVGDDSHAFHLLAHILGDFYQPAVRSAFHRFVATVVFGALLRDADLDLRSAARDDDRRRAGFFGIVGFKGDFQRVGSRGVAVVG